MKINKSIKLGIFFLIGILLLTSFVMAYYRSQTNYVQYGPYDRTNFMGTEGMMSDRMCKAGQDFILQVSPLGCEPAMVRSDLLEEQNVPVFCPISATQMNPLIDVQAINTMTITGKYPREVATVGFHPAESALLQYQNQLSQPIILDNIGYAVIVLRKQPNESAMPDYIEGNLTARIRYDIQNAFGVGQSQFYLPVLDENDWSEKYKQSSFWDGRGYLRAEGVYDDKAIISIYSDQSRGGILGQGDSKMLYSTVTLREGETSRELYIPGFDFCLATMRIRLDGLEAPDIRARLSVNGNPVEVGYNERFLENNCRVVGKPVKNGINQEVSIRCTEDREGFHKGRTILFKITPSVALNINGVEKNYSLGDVIYEFGNADEKRIFLGYIGEDGKGDLFIIPVISPARTKEQFLSSTIARKMPEFIKAVSFGSEQGVLTEAVLTLYKGTYGSAIMIGGWAASGAFPMEIIFEDKEKDLVSFMTLLPKLIDNVIGQRKIPNIELVGFAGAEDSQLPANIQEEFEKAKEDYRTLINNFPDEENEDEKETFGESALYNLINLAKELNQKIAMTKYCEEYKQKYPDSRKSLQSCENKMKMSSLTSSVTEVLIDNEVYQISFEGVYEPSLKELSTKITLANAGDYSGSITAGINQRIPISEEEDIVIKEIKENSVVFDVSSVDHGVFKEFTYDPQSLKINLNDYHVFGKESYKIIVDEVNLEKVAKVSLIPNINHAQTNASFNFRVNIDKRNIKLSPEKTQEKIEKLEKDIKKWTSVSEGLSKVVQTMKLACLGTSAYLTVKNYVDNVGGKGIARDKVMNSEGGWYERCDYFVSQKIAGPNGEKYSTQEECLIENSNYVDKNVEELYGFMDARQEYMQSFYDDAEVKGEELFSQKQINNSVLASKASETTRDGLDVVDEIFKDPDGNGKPIAISEIKKVLTQEGYDQNKYEIEQLRDIGVYTEILEKSNDPYLRDMAEKNLYSTLIDIQINSVDFRTLQDLSSKYNARESILISTQYTTNYPLSNPSTFGEIKSQFSGGSSIDSNSYVVTSQDKATAEDYLFILNDNYVVTQTYLVEQGVLSVVNEKDGNPLKIGFEKYNDASYKNEYKNPEIRYYENEPYKGYPALVPFDLNEGWYVAIKQDLPVFGGTATYSKSGRVESYYLCNVGRNRREENIGGDDICRSVNSLQGDNSNQFPGISDPGKVSYLLKKASAAVFQAQNARDKTGKVTINGKRIPVGNPAVDVPGMKCQDFMSPKDCNLLFNVCDPVVCPSSRCDFGGNYPVKNVIQSGILGSIALCLPNYKEGIKIPVCLTGIQAGLDGWLSVKSSYQDCLQESLDTGQTVGICDEIQSVYMCEYFYRQALPLAKLGIPKLTELIVNKGKGTRGGGEYLGVADAWQRAESSMAYFAQYYARNSYEAFRARSMEEAGQEIVCDKFLSISYPGGDFLDAITTPDSPVQFYGRFDEIPYTSVTNPPQSQYKVYYHIYAGKDRGSYYRVYFKGNAGSSFYRDTISNIPVATGYIPKGEYASETKDFLAPSGYKELCIMVNGQEECGFKEVTTNFAVNYVRDSYLKSQASQTDIKTESDCISGTSSLYSLLNPNIQAGAEQALNPAIYNEGIIRICATRNPGEGIDGRAGQEGSRWREVGYCGDNNLKCWLDTLSVEKAIDFKNLEEDVLETTNANYQSILREENGYLSGDAVKSSIKEIKEPGLSNQEEINKINEIIDKVFFNSEKASLLYLRGNAYGAIAKALYKEIQGDCKIAGESWCIDDENYKKCSSKLKWEGSSCSSSKRCVDTPDGAKCINKESIVGGETEIQKTSSFAENPEDLIFEFKDGRIERNICYKFDKEWFWSRDCNTVGEEVIVTSGEAYAPDIYKSDWIPVTSLENPYGGEPSKRTLGIIEGLERKNFESGLEYLLGRVKNDGKELATEKTTYFNSEIFSFSPGGGEPIIYFKYNNIWYGNFDKNNENTWVKILESEEDIFYSGNPTYHYLELRSRLSGKNPLEGAKILFLVFEEEDTNNLEPTGEIGEIPSGKTCPASPEVTPEIQAISSPNLKVIEKIKQLVGTPVPDNLDVDGDKITTCFDPAYYVYESAGVDNPCKYSDKDGREYEVFGTTIITEIAPTQKQMDAGASYPAFAVNPSYSCSIVGRSGSSKLELIEEGSLLSYASDRTQGHSVIFVEWDPALPNAKVFGWKWISRGQYIFDYSNVNLSDNSHPVYMIWKPELVY